MTEEFNVYAEGYEHEEYRPKRFCKTCRVEMLPGLWPAVHAQSGDWMGYFRAWECPKCGQRYYDGKDNQ